MRWKLRLVLAVLTAGVASAGVALAAASPSVVTGGTSSVRQTSAVLHGTVNPNGSATTYYFQWGLTDAYGSAGPATSAGNGTSSLSVQQTAGHLTPGTTYHYRLLASNPSGTTTGADRTFTTAGHPPPTATTGPAIQLSSSGATLTGTVNPSGQSTSWYFQWGSLSSLSQQTAPQTLAPASSPQNVAWSLAGLLHAGTLYQYRLVATHSGGVRTYASTAIFMTYPSTRPYARVRVRTTPRHARRRPYRLSIAGTVRGPYWIPQQFACRGEVTIRFYDGRHQVRLATAPVQPDCTFSGQVVFSHLPGGRRAPRPVRLREVVHFLSTPYLANGRPAVAPVSLG